MATYKHYFFIAKELIKSIKIKRRIKKISDYKKRREEAFEYGKFVCQKILSKIDVKINTIGLENVPQNEGVLFVPNHQGNFDILTLIATSPIPLSFISKEENKKIPIINDWMELIGCIFINRKKGREAIKKINLAFRNIKENGSLVLFPEGTRSKGKVIGEFKKAGLKNAIKNNVTIVPITIDGTYLIMEANKNKLGQAEVNIFYHSPIRKIEGESEDEFILRIRGIIESNIEK